MAHTISSCDAPTPSPTPSHPPLRGVAGRPARRIGRKAKALGRPVKYRANFVFIGAEMRLRAFYQKARLFWREYFIGPQLYYLEAPSHPVP